MTALSIDDAMHQACAVVGIEPPKRRPVPGAWVRTDSKGKNGKNDAAVFLDPDLSSGVAYNYQTAQSQRFRIGRAEGVKPREQWRDDAREREREAERLEVRRICEAVVKGCRQDRHAYYDAKGFPDELGLVCDDPREFFPAGRFGEALARSIPDGGGLPFLIVPGRIDGRLSTVQFITTTGEKKNILRGQMGGAFHRIASGRETWVCEGIGTALSVRAALRLLGRSATVLSAFSASNVGKVAEAIPGAWIAADHDAANDNLDGLGAGEFYARRSGRKWTMPPSVGDFNDMGVRDGLRAVALHLREALG